MTFEQNVSKCSSNSNFYLQHSSSSVTHEALKKQALKSLAQESGTLSLVFFYLKTVGASSVHLRHETTTRYSLKATTKISLHSRNKNVPILRSQNTQKTQTPIKTGSEQSVKFFFIRQWDFDPFQMDQPKTRLIST